MRSAWAIFPILFFALEAAGDWRTHARRLNGESKKASASAVHALRSDPGIRVSLRHAFESKDRFLAFDVVSALKMREFLPDLLRHADRDETGYAYHALNTLLEPSDHPSIYKTYETRLASRGGGLAPRLAILDSLTRMPGDLREGLLGRLIRDDSPEIRSAALYYARSRLLRRGRRGLEPLVRIALHDPAFQVRAQAETLAMEIGMQRESP